MSFFPDMKTFITIGSLHITWYAVFILGGAFLAYTLASRTLKKFGYKDELIENFFIFMLPIAIIGARLYYVIFEWEQYASNPISALYIWEGGLAIHGGLLAGIIFGYFYFKKHHVDGLRVCDAAFPFVMLAQAIGRWGNFMNQEAYGSIVEPSYFNGWPSFIADNMYIDGYYRQPTFLFESVGNIIGFILIYFVYRKFGRKRRGDLAYAYFSWYGMVRFFVESMRSDSLMLGNIRVAQLVSVLLIIFGILGILGVYEKIFKNIYPFKRKKPSVIFDLDGTLLDTRDIVYASYKHVFEVYKPDYQLSDEELRSFFGPAIKVSMAKYFEPSQIDDIINCYREYYNEHYDEYIKEVPGVKETLEYLKEHDYPLAIMSNKLKSVIDMGLEKADLAKYFSVVLGQDEIEKPKPSPQGLLNACTELQTGWDDLIYIGDNVSDIEACKAIQGYSVAFTLDSNEKTSLLAAKPCAFINKMEDLITLVESNQIWSEDFNK